MMPIIKKTLYLSIATLMAVSFAPQSYAKEAAHGTPHENHSEVKKGHKLSYLERTESKYICMVNNKRFDKVQIPTEIDGKTYYGCCSMCKTKLKNSQELREATDPISGNIVDKATAIIATDPNGNAYYFESEDNMEKFDKTHASHNMD